MIALQVVHPSPKDRSLRIAPWFTSQLKRKLSTATASAALRADAAESALCGYLSIIALAGLVVKCLLVDYVG